MQTLDAHQAEGYSLIKSLEEAKTNVPCIEMFSEMTS